MDQHDICQKIKNFPICSPDKLAIIVEELTKMRQPIKDITELYARKVEYKLYERVRNPLYVLERFIYHYVDGQECSVQDKMVMLEFITHCKEKHINKMLLIPKSMRVNAQAAICKHTIVESYKVILSCIHERVKTASIRMSELGVPHSIEYNWIKDLK